MNRKGECNNKIIKENKSCKKKRKKKKNNYLYINVIIF